MTRRFRLVSVAGLCACVAGVMLVATAARAYDAEYVFGDSLSDNGNAALGASPPMRMTASWYRPPGRPNTSSGARRAPDGELPSVSSQLSI